MLWIRKFKLTGFVSWLLNTTRIRTLAIKRPKKCLRRFQKLMKSFLTRKSDGRTISMARMAWRILDSTQVMLRPSSNTSLMEVSEVSEASPSALAVARESRKREFHSYDAHLTLYVITEAQCVAKTSYTRSQWAWKTCTRELAKSWKLHAISCAKLALAQVPRNKVR